MEDCGQKINQWNLFTNTVSNELMSLPIVPTMGNHDAINNNNTNSNAKNFYR